MNRIKRFIRSHYVTPLSKSVNSRHLALEPLCCIQSCKIRSGCYTAALFEVIGILAILTYSSSQLARIFSQNDNYNRVKTYADFAQHPSSYIIIIIFCFFWILSVGLMLFGVKRFNARLIELHLIVQLASLVLCVVIAIATGVQLATRRSHTTLHHHGQDYTPTTTPADPHADLGGTVVDATSASVVTTTRKGAIRMTEQLGLLTTSLYLLAVQLWGVSVVYDCYKYFKLCQVLVNLANAHKHPNGAGVASGPNTGAKGARNATVGLSNASKKISWAVEEEA